MKLKKIASLMLAGVMAVSMLAGCATTSVDPEPNQPEEPTTPTGYSATLQNKLSAHANDSITLSDSNELNNALNYAAGFVGDATITGEFGDEIFDGKVTYVDYWSNAALVEARDSLYDALSVKVKDDTTYFNASNLIARLDPAGKAPSDPAYYTKKDVNTVLLYAVAGNVSMENVMEEIANDIDQAIVGLTESYKVTDNGTSDAFFNYTGSVATCTKTYEAGHGMSVTLVAVEIVRHIGK